MAGLRLARPAAVVHSAPWPVLAGISLTAAALFCLAGGLRRHEMGLLVALMAVGTISSASAKQSRILEAAASASMYTPPQPKCRKSRRGPDTR